MKWKHALDEGLGAIQKGIEVYHTGKALWEIGKVVVSMLIQKTATIYNTLRRTTRRSSWATPTAKAGSTPRASISS